MPALFRPTRRVVLLTAAAATLPLAAPTILRASEGGRRSFAILRDGDEIGTHVTTLSRSGDEVQMAVDIEIKVKLLGITAYRYEMSNREVWKAGRLISMDSVVNDDGDPDHAKARAAGGMIEIDGSDHQGTVPGDSVSTTYWSFAFLERKVWINTQTGVPITVATAAAGPGQAPGPNGPIATQRWTAKGDNLDIVLHYIDREWVSIEFDANGEPGVYRPDSIGPALQPVWDASV